MAEFMQEGFDLGLLQIAFLLAAGEIGDQRRPRPRVPAAAAIRTR